MSLTTNFTRNPSFIFPGNGNKKRDYSADTFIFWNKFSMASELRKTKETKKQYGCVWFRKILKNNNNNNFFYPVILLKISKKIKYN